MDPFSNPGISRFLLHATHHDPADSQQDATNEQPSFQTLQQQQQQQEPSAHSTRPRMTIPSLRRAGTGSNTSSSSSTASSSAASSRAASHYDLQGLGAEGGLSRTLSLESPAAVAAAADPGAGQLSCDDFFGGPTPQQYDGSEFLTGVEKAHGDRTPGRERDDDDEMIDRLFDREFVQNTDHSYRPRPRSRRGSEDCEGKQGDDKQLRSFAETVTPAAADQWESRPATAPARTQSRVKFKGRGGGGGGGGAVAPASNTNVQDQHSTDLEVFQRDDSLCPPTGISPAHTTLLPQDQQLAPAKTRTPVVRSGLSNVAMQIQKSDAAHEPTGHAVRHAFPTYDQLLPPIAGSSEVTPTSSNISMKLKGTGKNAQAVAEPVAEHEQAAAAGAGKKIATGGARIDLAPEPGSAKSTAQPAVETNAGEYLPGGSMQFNKQPLFSIEDYATFTGTLSQEQVKNLPFSVRRKLKALLVTGTASENDIAAVAQNLDPMLYFSGWVPLRSLNEAEQQEFQAMSPVAPAPALDSDQDEKRGSSSDSLASQSGSGTASPVNPITIQPVVNAAPVTTAAVATAPRPDGSTGSPSVTKNTSNSALHFMARTRRVLSSPLYSPTASSSVPTPNTDYSMMAASPTTTTAAMAMQRQPSHQKLAAVQQQGMPITGSPAYYRAQGRPSRSNTVSSYTSISPLAPNCAPVTARPAGNENLVFGGGHISRNASFRNTFGNKARSPSEIALGSNSSLSNFADFFGTSAGAAGAAGASNTGMPIASPAMQYLTKFGSTASSPLASRRGSMMGMSSLSSSLSSSLRGSVPGTAGNNGDELGLQVGEYIIGKQIAHGGFSKVREARTIVENGREVVRAVKIMDTRATALDEKVVAAIEQYLTRPSSSSSSPASRKKTEDGHSEQEIIAEIIAERSEYLQSQIDHEVLLWKALDHENILKLRSVTETAGSVYCFADRITGGTLYDLVKSEHKTGLGAGLVVGYARQLAQALLYLHETMRIVHRDVKLENCLIEESEDAETCREGEPEPLARRRRAEKLLLCDFGMSDYFGDEDDAYEDEEDVAEGEAGAASYPSPDTDMEGEEDCDEAMDDVEQARPQAKKKKKTQSKARRGDDSPMSLDPGNRTDSSLSLSSLGATTASSGGRARVHDKVVGPSETSSIMDHYHHHQSLHQHKRHLDDDEASGVRRGSSSDEGSAVKKVVAPQTPVEESKPRASPSSVARQHSVRRRNPSRHGSLNATTSGGSVGSGTIGGSAGSASATGRRASLGSLSATTEGEEHFGSFPYAAPEVLQSSAPIYEASVDMWAFGVVVYALVMGDLPWSHALLPVLRERIVQGEWDERGVFKRMYRHTKHWLEEEDGQDLEDVDGEATGAAYRVVHLLRGCLEKDPRKRLTIRQVVDGGYLD